jgi:hypothetical protein
MLTVTKKKPAEFSKSETRNRMDLRIMDHRKRRQEED